MRSFKNGQRVRVKEKAHSLYGKTGTVVRRLISEDAAWVNMDEPLAEAQRRFGAEDDRANHFLLYPEECEAID